MKLNSINLKKDLQDDNLYPTIQVLPLADITGMPCRKGLTRAVISEGEIVNVVSNSYGHLPNENFFNVVEEQLIDAEINYIQRTINRENRSFAADYILSDDSFHISIKNGMDKLRPMLRFTNSYDGSCKTSGHFGFFREVCTNGLHIATTNFGFSIKHRGNLSEIVVPEIKGIIQKFIDNEYYTLQRKFEVMAETPIVSLDNYIKMTAEEFNLFKYESSENNPAPSINARIVAESIKREANLLGTQPNYWLGYNAFNELLHGKLKKTFENQRVIDGKLFAHSLSLVN